MQNNTTYVKFKQLALDGNYSIEQVQNTTKEQVETLVNTAVLKPAFVDNMKRLIINDLQQQNDQQDMEQLKQQAGAWLDSNFPDWQAERGRKRDKPFVKIWLKGKP